MKTLMIILTMVCTTAIAQDHSQHTKKDHHETKVSGKKLQPTADLKIRMEKISGLVKELKAKKGDVKSAQEYGVKISDVVSDIFKTCKLEPAADEAIHPVLANILDGSEDLKKGSTDQGYNKIHKSLLDYQKLFSVK